MNAKMQKYSYHHNIDDIRNNKDESNKKIHNRNSIFITILLGVLFATSLIDIRIELLLFIVSCLLVWSFRKRVYDTVLFCMCVQTNSALCNGSLGFISINRLILVVYFVGILDIIIKCKKTNKIRLRNPAIYLFWFVYMALDSIIIHNEGIDIFTNTIPNFMLMSYLMLTYINYNDRSANKFLVYVVTAFNFIVYIGYLELLIGHTFYYSQWTGEERYRFGILRVGSTVSDPNNICFMILPMLFILNTKSIGIIIGRKRKIILQILYLLLILFTGSRTAVVALVIGMIFVILSHKRRLLLVIIPAFAIIADRIYFVLEEKLLSVDANSSNWRLLLNQLAFKKWIESPIFGHGISKITSINSTGSNLMNSYLFQLFCFGIIGFSFMLIYIVWFSKKDIIDYFKKKQINRDSVLRIGFLIVMGIIMYTLDTMYYSLVWVAPAIFEATRNTNQIQKSYLDINKKHEILWFIGESNNVT